jgi:hypothetical protein
MDRWQHILSFYRAHSVEIWLAVVCALFFAVVLELLNFGSRLRGVIRWVRNKLAENSAAQLRKRIIQLETSRAQYASYLTSDKALYLATFRLVSGAISALALGLLFTEFATPVWFFYAFATLFYVLALALGIQGATISALDTRDKITKIIGKLDSDIAALEKLLPTNQTTA